jgi:predicted glycosyltransferase
MSILPPGVEYLALPKITSSGELRRFPLPELVNLRRKLLLSSVQTFNPHILLVEHNSNFESDELDQTLEWCIQNGRRSILILKDTIPDPASRKYLEHVIRNTYDFAWVLGDGAILNWVREYGLSLDLIQKLRYVGYLDHRVRSEWFEQEGSHGLNVLGLPPGHLVVCLAGEGKAGETLAEAFSQVHLPPKTNGIIICGTRFNVSLRQKLQRRLAGYPRLRLIEVSHDYAWILSAAERIVALGSYDRVSEILSFEKKGFVILNNPNPADAIRAKLFQKLNLLEFVSTDCISPDPLNSWLAKEVSKTSNARNSVSLNALKLLPNLLKEALTSAKASIA